MGGPYLIHHKQTLINGGDLNTEQKHEVVKDHDRERFKVENRTSVSSVGVPMKGVGPVLSALLAHTMCLLVNPNGVPAEKRIPPGVNVLCHSWHVLFLNGSGLGS